MWAHYSIFHNNAVKIEFVHVICYNNYLEIASNSIRLSNIPQMFLVVNQFAEKTQPLQSGTFSIIYQKTGGLHYVSKSTEKSTL